MDTPGFRFEPLHPARHNRAAFFCNVAPLDRYLKTQACQDIKKNLSAVFVCTADGKNIAGYYTLSHHSVVLDDIPQELSEKLTRYGEVPATLIGRLAVALWITAAKAWANCCLWMR